MPPLVRLLPDVNGVRNRSLFVPLSANVSSVVGIKQQPCYAIVDKIRDAPDFYAMTGTPEAMASKTTIGQLSSNVGRTKRDAVR